MARGKTSGQSTFRGAQASLWIELCAMDPLMGPEAHSEWMRYWRRVKVEETAAARQEVGAQTFIPATDLGQTGNPSLADGRQLFVTDLIRERDVCYDNRN
ncbi:hypothetical protein SAMN05216338_105341 [Bradyrhizobium sp. Rc2d]|uniref:hypothetical protein n=1 Tax=Bradyrhizobium sp. Rc2d TaxID=1855321 RepID=UPI00088CF4FA|nr:hypothetical protein [Bradyrhizobium sp. Rc2d]SDJ54148.1 hypothetical protein SAMN05216338_105341 [Bradyrhizobium sp. Rc2d]